MLVPLPCAPQVKAISNVFKNNVCNVKGGEELMMLAGWKTEVGGRTGWRGQRAEASGGPEGGAAVHTWHGGKARRGAGGRWRWVGQWPGAAAGCHNTAIWHSPGLGRRGLDRSSKTGRGPLQGS